MQEYIFCVSHENSKKRLDAFLANHIPELSRTRLKSLIEEGHVTLNQSLLSNPAYKVKEGEVFSVYIPPAEEMTLQAQELPLKIIYEDADLLVLDKPAGLVVHPAPGNPDHTLVNALLAHCGSSLSGIGGVKRPGIVHRLDKETSGLMVVAKTDHAHQGLCEQFKDHTLARTYKAFIRGHIIPPAGTIEGNIDRSHKDRKKMTITRERGRPAKTHYKTLENFWASEKKPLASLIECKLETGRTHQIRLHLAHKGHSVLGDTVYGHTPKESPLGKFLISLNWKEGRQALHAYALTFIHPTTGETLSFTASFPEDLKKLHQALLTYSGESPKSNL